MTKREEWGAALDKMRDEAGFYAGFDSLKPMLLDLIEALEKIASDSPKYIEEPRHWKEHVAIDALEKLRSDLDLKPQNGDTSEACGTGGDR